jgi:hypothetical protein
MSGPIPVARSRTRRHRFTLTRSPEPSVLVPIGTDLAESSWGGPSSFGSFDHGSSPVAHPKVADEPVCLAAPPVECESPRPLRTLQQVPVSPPCPKVGRSPV